MLSDVIMIEFVLPNLNDLFSLFSGDFALPCAIAACLIVMAALCCCVNCMRCQPRDFLCLKRLFLWTGRDKFDDFELMVLVHEAIFEKTVAAVAKLTTIVRLTAGNHVVKTESSSNSIFQQPLHVLVEQGTKKVVVDLLDGSSRVLASLMLDPAQDIIGVKRHEGDKLYKMKIRDKRIRSPKIKLSIVVSTDPDMEQGLLSDMNSDVDILVRQQFLKCGQGLSEMEVLKQSCAGPLELFEGLGTTTNIWVAVQGPPTSRKWMLGIWSDRHSFDSKKAAFQEVDLLKIQSVQADPIRNHIFVINYYDESRVQQSMHFRRVDRARDVWVEIFHLLVQRAHDSRRAMKRDKGHSNKHIPSIGRSPPRSGMCSPA